MDGDLFVTILFIAGVGLLGFGLGDWAASRRRRWDR